MTQKNDTLLAYLQIMQKKAPEYLDLLSAETDTEFEKAFSSLLDRAICHLEENKKNFERLDEEGLSAALSGSLSIPGLTITQETNSNGHVDLLIRADHCVPTRKKLAEAKIYSGYAYHVSGLSQLLKRYTTGREGCGLLIIYIRKKNIKGLMDRLRTDMDANSPEEQIGVCMNHLLRWSFISEHEHSSGEKLQVAHVGCNLYIDT
jgi:hypothetical protein